MQKNNCKLKTIFKKGLSFSIALALGAAATSLNLAKTAEAAVDTKGARTVYLAGENAEFTTSGWTNKPTHYSTDDGKTWIDVATPVKLTSDMTKLKIASDGSGAEATDYTFTVYDWSEIYKGTSVKLSNKFVHDSARDAIVDALILNIPSSKNADVAKISGLLKTGELQTTDGIKIDNVDYAKHNGKDVQIKLPAANNNLVCNLGTLDVTRAITGVELVSGPTENCYLAGEKINLDGLSLKVTYDTDESGTVEWTEDTQSNFSFNVEGVKHGGNIDSTISNITVTYTDPATKSELKDEKNKFTLYVVSTQTKAAEGIASVTGNFDSTFTSVNAVSLSEDSEKYTKLKSAFAENAQVIFAYDILAGYEASVGKMRVALKVGKNYAGQVVTVKHLANDEIETFVNKVDEDGNVTVEVNSLSPFMVVLGATEEDKAAAAETEQKNAEEAAKTEAAKTEAASKSASKSAKTGDTSVVAFSVFGFVALISAAVLAFMKKNRKNFEK